MPSDSIFLEAVLKLLEKFIKHNHREGELHDGFGSLGEILVVKGEPPEVLQPGEGALHDPPLGQHGEPGRAVVGPEDDLEVPSEPVGHPVPEPSAVASVGKYPPQPRELALKPFDDRHRPPCCRGRWPRGRRPPAGGRARRPPRAPSCPSPSCSRLSPCRSGRRGARS